MLLLAKVVLVVLEIHYDLRDLFGQEQTTVAGQVIPLGDVNMVMPALIRVCALILLIRTRGGFMRGWPLTSLWLRWSSFTRLTRQQSRNSWV